MEERTSIKIKKDLYLKLKDQGKKERRTVSALMDWAVEEFLKKRR